MANAKLSTTTVAFLAAQASNPCPRPLPELQCGDQRERTKGRVCSAEKEQTTVPKTCATILSLFSDDCFFLVVPPLAPPATARLARHDGNHIEGRIAVVDKARIIEDDRVGHVDADAAAPEEGLVSERCVTDLKEGTRANASNAAACAT